LHRRWTLRILCDLREAGTVLSRRALQAACGDLSASVLEQRLTGLREAPRVEHDGAIGCALAPQAPRADGGDRCAAAVGAGLGGGARAIVVAPDSAEARRAA
jgi:hypothetical protein